MIDCVGLFVITMLIWSPCCCHAFSSAFSIIETDVAPELEFHVVTAPVNQPIKLRCHELKGKSGVSGLGDIVWVYKKCGNGLSLTACEDLPESSEWLYAECRNRTKLCTGPTLPISDPQESDSGLYRCLHKNYMNPKFNINRTIQLEVRDSRSKSMEVLPESPDLDNQTVTKDQTALLRCRVRSVEYPTIFWIRKITTADPLSSNTVSFNGDNYQFLKASEIHEGADKLYTSKLYINPVTLNDAGEYLCFALDGRQEVSKTAVLNVIPALYLQEETSFSNYELWWIALALVLSATSCMLIHFFNIHRNRRKMESIPTEDVADEYGSSSLC